MKPTLSTLLSCNATVSHSPCAGLPPLPAQLLLGMWHPGCCPQGWAPGWPPAATWDGELGTALGEHLGATTRAGLGLLLINILIKQS